jgi:hypothetical protein
MSTTAVVTRLDRLLTPLGFERQKQTWNRRSGPFVDVVDIQGSKADHAITLNAGVMDPDVHRKCWGTGPPAWVDEPSCTVRTRIGQLMGNKDVWWSPGDGEAVEKIAEAVAAHVLPFLDRMHARGAMEEFLVDAEVLKRKYPPPIVYLAILRNELGDHSGGCAALEELQQKTVGAWRTRISEVSGRLGCS